MFVHDNLFKISILVVVLWCFTINKMRFLRVLCYENRIN